LIKKESIEPFAQKSELSHRKMDRIPIWVLPILIFLITPVTISQEEEVKQALVQFMDKLSPGQRNGSWGWNMTSDPCYWSGVTCYPHTESVSQIAIENSDLSGVLDFGSVCMVKSLLVLSLAGNKIYGTIGEEIGKCKQLTHLYLNGNNFSGSLPDSLSHLGDLKRLEISDNNFSGELPDLPRISGLKNFLAENNNLSGGIPNFDFLKFDRFNVSNNNFSGPIPDVQGLFTADSFSGNPGLCGQPLSAACPPAGPASPSSIMEPKASTTSDFLVYSGYMILGMIIVLFFAVKIIRKRKTKEETIIVVEKERVAGDASSDKPSEASNDRFRFGVNKSEYSMTSIDQSSIITSTLVVLTSPLVPSLRFEELLRAPAELLGRGKHGSLYKVMLDGGVNLAVKRIKDWDISDEDFRRRMKKIDRSRHSNVLPPIAFYCSKQEKLLVYEFQQNGSLFQLLHGKFSF
jgi:hypothetical protein